MLGLLTFPTASMLREDQESRPTIYEALREACAMQGRYVPIKDVRVSLFVIGTRNPY
jgi:AP2-associated kinase